MDIPVLFSRKEECCGCTACLSACPKGAVSMEEDEEGFAYPVIDPALCIRCGSCLRVCQMKTERDSDG